MEGGQKSCGSAISMIRPLSIPVFWFFYFCLSCNPKDLPSPSSQSISIIEAVWFIAVAVVAMKWVCFLWLLMVLFPVHAEEGADPFGVHVAVTPVRDAFHVQAGYAVPVPLCNAFAYLTDYEDVNGVPGVLAAKVLSRNGNKVQVEKTVEEKILFFRVELKSVLEYTESPNQRLRFEQLSGDTKQYRGAWTLAEDKGKTVFSYDAYVEPNSMIPSFVVQYFIKNDMRERFEMMAERVSQKASVHALACR
jgi:hypothetical protein